MYFHTISTSTNGTNYLGYHYKVKQIHWNYKYEFYTSISENIQLTYFNFKQTTKYGY